MLLQTLVAVVAVGGAALGGLERSGLGDRLSPACGLANAPCPQPSWTPTWQLNRSTMLMTCNDTGFVDAHTAARFG